MARGDEAKNAVVSKIMSAFGDDFVAYQDKKIYVWSREGNEKVQVALSLTCPKTTVGSIPVISNSIDLEHMGETFTAPSPSKSSDISEEEKENIKKLMERLGI